MTVNGLSGIVKAVSGKLSAATAGTDYATPAQVSAKQNTITASGILKGNGSGTISAAVAGTDYLAVTSGTTTSGTYLKFNNSKMICYGSLKLTTDSLGQVTITFPASFTSKPSISVMFEVVGSYDEYINIVSATSTYFKLGIRKITSGSSAAATSISTYIHYIAIGSWS